MGANEYFFKCVVPDISKNILLVAIRKHVKMSRKDFETGA